MSDSTPPNPIAGAVIRVVVLFAIAVTGLLTAFMSQASSPDYRALFWKILPFALFHFGLVIGYFTRVHRWHRWLAIGFGALAALGFAEMALRVWL